MIRNGKELKEYHGISLPDRVYHCPNCDALITGYYEKCNNCNIKLK